jgi:predicted Zn-ribbon and HTH transcriptional regulator
MKKYNAHSGWFLESRRHSLASMGIKTGRKSADVGLGVSKIDYALKNKEWHSFSELLQKADRRELEIMSEKIEKEKRLSDTAIAEGFEPEIEKNKHLQKIKCEMCGLTGTSKQLYHGKCPKCGSKSVWETKGKVNYAKKPDVNSMNRAKLEKMLVSYIGTDSPLISDMSDKQLRAKVKSYLDDDDLYEPLKRKQRYNEIRTGKFTKADRRDLKQMREEW